MKRSCLLLLMLLAAKCGAPRSDAAVEDHAAPTNRLALESLVMEALQQNPESRFFEAEITAAAAGRKSAGLLANPELTVSTGQKSVRGDGMSAEGAAWSASVLQPFEWPGRLGLRKAIANYDLELARLGFEQFKIALAAQVRLLAYKLFAAEQQAVAAREVVDRFEQLREVLLQRDPTGLTPLLETRVIEATELTMQRRASDAELAVQTALLELNRLRGRAPQSALAIATPSFVFRKPETADVLLSLARTNNFDLRLRTIELAQQGARVALAKNERFPAFSVGPTVSEERAGDRERIISLGVAVPLPIWNRNREGINAANARRIQAEVALTIAERDLDRKILAALFTYQRKKAEMDKWRSDAVEHFREAAETADRHYRLGAVPVATYVELQKQYLEAVESLLTTQREALEAGQNLELLTGVTPSLVGFANGQEALP